MTGDEYMALLVKRRDEWEAEHPRDPRAAPWVRPLLEWFIRDGDESLVDDLPPDPEPSPVEPKRPRRYKSVSELNERRDRLQAEHDRLAKVATLPDRAASHGVALGAARTARHQQRADRALERAVQLAQQIAALDDKIARARRRETNT